MQHEWLITLLLLIGSVLLAGGLVFYLFDLFRRGGGEAAPPLLLAGGITLMAGVGFYIWDVYGPKPPPLPPPPSPTAARLATITPSPTPFMPVELTMMPMPTPTVDPHAAWRFGNIDFASGDRLESIVIVFEGIVTMPGFDSYPWTPSAFDSGVFDVGQGTGLAWNDEAGRVGLWIHSGYGQTADLLQRYIERDEHGFLRTYTDAEARLEGMRGTAVTIIQNGNVTRGVIADAARVAPLSVPALNTHVVDLVAYENERNALLRIATKTNVLMLFFCGERLGGEERNKAEPHFRQSRYIIAIVEAPE